MINTYLATSKEFQPIVVTKNANGVVTNVLTGVQYCAVPKGTSLSTGTLLNAIELDGEIGFFTDTLTVGYWEIGIKISAAPESPLISCGHIRIK